MLHNVFIWFLDKENIGLAPQIMILHEVISKILEMSDFAVAEINSESQFFSGNIANMIPESPLKEMVPLMEDHGGCMRTPVSS